jgi:D-alanyl-lipoteichoic acid acyltransferase DltB (MBOAT superfamily)
LLLSSSTYFVFLVAIFFLYWPLARVRSLGLAVILFANYFFYAKWDVRYLMLIPGASTCDYLFGLGLQSSKRPAVRRLLVTASIVMNIGLLATLRWGRAGSRSSLGPPSTRSKRSPIRSTCTAATPRDA